jgi:KUP system potassium uptake protein
VTAGFLVIDLAFWGANLIKIPHGGWFPLVVGAVVFALLTTWKKGRQILAERLRESAMPRDTFLESIARGTLTRVTGTAVFMFGDSRGTPAALLHSLKHYKVLHERVVFLAVVTHSVPIVSAEERVEVHELGNGFWQVRLAYGFMEEVDIPRELGAIRQNGLSFKPLDTTYFLGRETLIATRRPGMALWRERLFATMSRNARPATAFFRLPPNRVVELGAQVEL